MVMGSGCQPPWGFVELPHPGSRGLGRGAPHGGVEEGRGPPCACGEAPGLPQARSPCGGGRRGPPGRAGPSAVRGLRVVPGRAPGGWGSPSAGAPAACPIAPLQERVGEHLEKSSCRAACCLYWPNAHLDLKHSRFPLTACIVLA